ncbi:hypothetical protein CXK94_13115 [Stutzerimonas stutzeri]|uniref:Uncharacterized protein n=1 Tax=Stutzerimonas stutzeri TaxID=316 RepID=A0A2N8T2I5_STUST|nr:hypothetical protein [Stutzerimonas stutzeri]MCQ4326912.1 hypothetical protein [Stutzerimonas stutzeri]PNG08961.1 hypothetical protein CXK94_13115 [Stutzerimonas stutzeri]
MDLLQTLLLALGAGAGALRVGRARRHYGEAEQPALFGALLGFVLLAASGAVGVAGFAGMAVQEAQQWLERASLLLGLPLIALAMLTLARGWAWSRPNWGRVVLGLCVCFELARQLGWSAPYALGLLLASALLVLYAGLLQWPARLPGVAGLGAAILLLAGTPMDGTPLENPLNAYRPLLLALASPLLAWLLLRLPNSAHGKLGRAA